MSQATADIVELKQRLTAMRGDRAQAPDASIVVPVNAKGDLNITLRLLSDIARYDGKHTIEIVFTVNNYAENERPEQIALFEDLGVRVVSLPSAKRPGQAPSFAARFPGLRAASAEDTIHFDADCRIPNPTALLDWYIRQLGDGAQLAYTRVDHFDVRRDLSVQARLATHYLSRWAKRTILGIPTARGGNFALRRTPTLELYDQGFLADELNIGPTIKRRGGAVVYSGARELRVLTSGRYLTVGWSNLARYLLYRLRYNMRVLPVRQDAAKHTGK